MTEPSYDGTLPGLRRIIILDPRIAPALSCASTVASPRVPEHCLRVLLCK
jgi:hypothetical protein